MQVKFILKHFCLYACLLLSNNLFGQSLPYLERPVTLHASNKTLAEIFSSISQQTQVVFSYAQTFNDQQRIVYHCNKRPLRIVLQQLLEPSDCRFKIKGKFLILTCDEKLHSSNLLLNGYVYNAIDSSRIEEASIYVKQTRHSVRSDKYGYFALSYTAKIPQLTVSFAKENFKDTSLILVNKRKQELSVFLYPIENKLPSKTINEIALNKDSFQLALKDTATLLSVRSDGFWNKFRTINANFRNISDTLFASTSISLVPYISTNHLLSVNTVNKYSFNILMGYSKGVNLLEIAGLLNIDNGNVQYVQLAGLGNIVSGDVKGVQAAGLINSNGGKAQLVQLAGLLNLNKNNFRGVQTAGIGNYVNGKTSGVQLSGVFNKATICKGVQLTGIVNIADTLIGLQTSGIVNKTHYFNGMQLAGIVNKADYFNGVQLGLINSSDSTNGIPIGIVSWVKKGYHKVSLSTDELQFAYLSFGTGVEKFHNVFIAGINYTNGNYYSLGYGIGSSFALNKRLGLSAELSTKQVFTSVDVPVKTNLYNQLFIGADILLQKKFRISLGPELTVYIADTKGADFNKLDRRLTSSDLYSSIQGNMAIKCWAGGKIALSFF